MQKITRRTLLQSAIGAGCFLFGRLPAYAEEGLFDKLVKGVKGVLGVVKEWNRLIDELTEIEVRRQVLVQISNLVSPIEDLKKAKQSILKLLDEKPIDSGKFRSALAMARNSTESIEGKMRQISVRLSQVTNSDIYLNLSEDMSEKSKILLEIENQGKLTPKELKKAKDNLKKANALLDKVSKSVKEILNKKRSA